MEKTWNIKESGEEEKVEHCRAFKYRQVLSNLLVQRGVQTFDEAKAFFRPDYEHLHDPFLMKDMIGH